ncbi:Methyl-accepting chemotaxis protein signailing-domain-containing protein, HAMP domain-containing [Desulfonema limicola]|uniref:Methyl-accepting chemotaxis protein signailing-domain-containing protein, HAMP domain-containing n=1 Tax=Desulfonema limicola TaxID=45656 RepID=A0A975B7R9_9BACT|nr:methyl-accepting chemotaxis protein [Desulfonema limicola]QTA80388.1 Methyl-accepting chemotaxis protein signailing-domain-containing protein, HAMP domain-containing [Desulfonema limicola]
MERIRKWIFGLSIGTKLQLSIVVIVLAALTVVLSIFITSYKNSVISGNKEILQTKADVVANYISATIIDGELLSASLGMADSPLSQKLKTFKPYNTTIITIINSQNIIVSMTDHEKEFVGESIDKLPEYSQYFNKSVIESKKKTIIEIHRPLDKKTVLCAFSPLPASNGIVMMDVEKQEILNPVNSFLLKIAGLTAVMFLLIILVIWLVADRTVVRPILNIMDIFGEIGKGNFEARAIVLYDDELGKMSQSLNAMLDNTLNLIQSSEERDSMQGSIMNLLEEISGLAEGDLTARAEVTEDFTGAIAESFNDMAEQLSEVVKNVKDVTLQVISTSQEVSRSTENLAETSEMQAVQVSETIEAINEMSTSIQQVAENAGQSAGVSEQSTIHAKEGAEIVRATNRAMESIREHAQETARAIKRLGESSQEIGNIVQLINDIADRTSILALNASIQAAMAGDAGRGFAVVAEEVQRLAERSTDATKQIDTLIKNIQGEINETGASMEESIQRVVEGSKLADGARKKLQEIETVSTQLGALIQSISMASKQQAKASEEIAKTMEEVGEISSQTSSASRQTAVSMKSLAKMSAQLNESVSVFRLSED